jgi:hypothetical protein
MMVPLLFWLMMWSMALVEWSTGLFIPCDFYDDLLL